MQSATTTNADTSLTISCRFVPHDQWLTTHVNPAWKSRQLKQYLLSKCFTHLSPPDDVELPQRHRPVSPITFASHHPSPEDEGGDTDVAENSNEPWDDDMDDWDLDLNHGVDIRRYRSKQQDYFKAHPTNQKSASISSTNDPSSPRRFLIFQPNDAQVPIYEVHTDIIFYWANTGG